MNHIQQEWSHTLDNKGAEYCALSVHLIHCLSQVAAHICYIPCWRTKFLSHLPTCKSFKNKSCLYIDSDMRLLFFIHTLPWCFLNIIIASNLRLPYETKNFRDTFSTLNFAKWFPFAWISDDELFTLITKKECDS